MTLDWKSSTVISYSQYLTYLKNILQNYLFNYFVQMIWTWIFGEMEIVEFLLKFLRTQKSLLLEKWKRGNILL